MEKFSRAIFLPVVMALCLCGSGRRQAPVLLEVVNQVDVLCRQGRVVQQRHYTSPEKMASVLNFLRLQENLGPAELDPERLVGDVYTIRVEMSGGGAHIYQQRADRFLSRDYRPWQKIDPGQGGNLYFLLQSMPSDG